MLYDIPTPVLILALLVGMAVAVEGGIRVGHRYGREIWLKAHQIHAGLAGAALALMGLMLAFTFSFSATRYELRRTLVVTEATAIQSVRSRLDFLAPDPRAQGLALLHDYVGERIRYLTVGHDVEREDQAAAQSRALFGGLWRLAAASDHYATTEPQLRAAQYAELTGALIDLNRVGREREAARDRTVPQSVIIMLFALAMGAGAVLSYTAGASGHPDRPPIYAVLVLVCLVIYLIIDFDRPRRGLMHLDPKPLQQQL